MIPVIHPFLISAKCSLRLRSASAAYHYYLLVDSTPTPANMNYTLAVNPFYVEHEAIAKLTKEDKPDVPILHKNLVPIMWIDFFRYCISRTFGICDVPLLYIVRESVTVTPEADAPLENSNSFGTSGSVLDELIERISHTHLLYKSDNSSIYSLLE